jgi:hypothetical protein
MPEDRPKLWRVPRLWPDRTCFIIGGGPSVAQLDIDRLRGQRIIAVNNAFKLAPWIDCVFFGDRNWYFWHKTELLAFAGLKVTICEAHLDKPGIKVVKRQNAPHGISRDAGVLTWNFSSGGCAINLAVHFGVNRIVLLGFDMKKVDGRCNYHNEHPPRNRPGYDPYPRFLLPFDDIARDLERIDVVCVNATPDSALKAFPMVTLEEELARLAQGPKTGPETDNQ